MNISVPCHRRCESCGEILCDEFTCQVAVRVVGAPLAGPLKGRRLLVTDLTIVGVGRWIVDYVHAAWKDMVPALDGRFYAYSGTYGVVRLHGLTRQKRIASFKDLEEHLGGAFVRAQRGIVVAVRDIRSLEDGMCGVRRNDARGCEPAIDWVICSRRGEGRIAELLG